MWDLRTVIVSGERRVEPGEEREPPTPFDGRMRERDEEEVTAVVADGYELVSAVTLANGNVMLWFKRPAVTVASAVFDVPGYI